MKHRTVQILSVALFLGLLLWGGYALLSYVGIPVHGMVLFTDAAQQEVSTHCGDSNVLCRGVQGLFPFLTYTIQRAAPFFWYVILSIVAYLLFVGWQGVQTGEFRVRIRWRPWHVIALFTACVWLLFTVLSMGISDGTPVLQIVEPSPTVYGEISKNQLEALQQNFDELQGKGCLSLLGESQEGVKIYRMRGICVQQSFFTKVVPPLLFIIVLLFEFLVLGRFLLMLIRVRPRGDLEETVLSMGLGAGTWIALLWFLAVFGMFTFELGWTLAIFLPILLLRQSRYWILKFGRGASETDVPWQSATVLLFWLLISYFALNYLTVIRPFPIGWDDLGSYLNRPRLLVSYGHFIPSMAPFQWEYLTSLGYLLFGYDSVFGAIASMMVNWTAGVLAVLAVILFTRSFLGNGRGLLAGLLYYSLPLVGHFSFADMKVDNAVFALGTLALYAIFVALFVPADETAPAHVSGWRKYLPSRWEWFLLSGLFMGFALAVKITAAMVFLAVIAAIIGTVHWGGLVGGIFLAATVLATQGVDVTKVAERLGMTPVSRGVVLGVLFLIAVGFMAFAAVRRRRSVIPAAAGLALFAVGVAITVFPWVEHNNLAQGRIIPRLELGMANTISPVIDYLDATGLPEGGRVRKLPADLRVDPEHPNCRATGSTEEMDRYWGFRQGWVHYLTLPWRMVMNIDSAGYYVTTIPAFLLFPLLLFLPFFWLKKERWVRWLFLLTGLIIVEWMFAANGIPWYGMGMFLGLVVVLETLVARAPDMANKIAVSTLIILSLFVAFAMRFWQFEQQRNLFEYSFGKVTAEALRIRTIPYYDMIRQAVVERSQTMPERPYLYRVGTFITYFIPKNLEVIGMTDHQLDQFNCLYQERDAELTLKRLKALGFNSIIFDTNTATIEKDVNGTLHQKAQVFVDFLNNPALGLQIVVSDADHGVAFVLIP